jgi:hypothetical protein
MIRNIKIFLLLLFLSATAFANSPFIWGPGEAVNLTNGIKYSNGIELLTGALDPSSSAVSADAGSIYFSTNGTAYIKQDSGLTANWLPFAASAGGGGITAINAQSGPTVTIAAGTSGTDFAVSSSANTITLNLPTASSTKRGALSSTDWSAFNGKEPAISAGTTSQYWRGDKSWQTLDKSAVGLPNVDNTSDASKPISTATQTALDLKADLASPTFTGTVSGITKSMVGLGNADNTSDATKNAAIATLTNKSIDAASNTITNIGNAEIKALAGIDPTKIGGGSVDNTEYSYLNGVTSAIQTQIDGKEPAITLLPLSKGGTNKNMTAVAGGVVYTDADSQEVLAAGSSGQILQSNATSAPSWVNKSISGKAQNASSVTVEEIQFPNDSLTQTASGKYLAQTGNNNILANPSVEHSTVQSNWSLTNGSSAVETSAVIQGQQSIKLTLTAQALEFFQTSTRYAAQFADGVQGAASIRVKTSVSGVFACPVQNSAIQYSLCAAHSGDGKWALLKVPFVLGGTNNGIAIISGTMSSGTVTPGSITGTVYVDDAYVGTDAGIADVSIITPWVAYTPTFTGFGTPSNVNFWWRQVGQSIEIQGRFTVGTSTATEARISLPNSYTISSNVVTLQNVGHGAVNVNASTYFSTEILAEPNLSYVTIGQQASTTPALSKVNGTAFSSGNIFTFQASVPIANLAGSTQVFASQGGAAYETSLTANVTGATGAISAQKIPGALSSSRSATGVYTINYTGLTVVPAITFDTSSPCTQSYISTAATSSAVGITTRNNSGVNADCDFTVTVDKQGADYISSRTIVGSFKEVMTAPGVTKPKTCVGSYGGTGSLASPTNCTASPCTEYVDTCGTLSTTRSTTGTYSIVAAAGTFAASSFVECDFSPSNGSNGLLIQYPPVTLASDASGGFTYGNVATQISGGAVTDTRFNIKCFGVAP